MAISVMKSSGRVESFDIRKLANSLMRSGAPEKTAMEIAQKVAKESGEHVHTKHIYRAAKRLLRKYNHVSGMRYSLKRSIITLGPTGYPFEKYIGRVLSAYGYTVEVNRMTKGFCVTHEVDVFAKKDDRICVIECKHHANGDKPEDIKIALYVHSRVNDIKRALESLPEYNSFRHEGWLVTNTRCSTDAIKYAECVGLKILSWKYPENAGLEYMIEQKRLYPITILPAATKNVVQTLTERGIVLADDIVHMEERAFARASGLDRDTAAALKLQADSLCQNACKG